jgi:hypothetical protein
MHGEHPDRGERDDAPGRVRDIQRRQSGGQVRGVGSGAGRLGIDQIFREIPETPLRHDAAAKALRSTMEAIEDRGRWTTPERASLL